MHDINCILIVFIYLYLLFVYLHVNLFNGSETYPFSCVIAAWLCLLQSINQLIHECINYKIVTRSSWRNTQQL